MGWWGATPDDYNANLLSAESSAYARQQDLIAKGVVTYQGAPGPNWGKPGIDPNVPMPSTNSGSGAQQRPSLANGNVWGKQVNGGQQIIGLDGSVVGYWNSNTGAISDQAPQNVPSSPAAMGPDGMPIHGLNNTQVGPDGMPLHGLNATNGSSDNGTPLGISFHGPTPQQVAADAQQSQANATQQVIKAVTNPVAIAGMAAPLALGAGVLAAPAIAGAMVPAGAVATEAGAGIPGSVGTIGAAGTTAAGLTAGATGVAGEGAAGAAGAGGAAAGGATATGAAAGGATATGAAGAAAGAGAADSGAVAGLASLLGVSPAIASGLLLGGSAVTGGALSYLAGKQQADAITSAATTQQNAFNTALTQQQNQFDKTNEINKGIYTDQQNNLKPWITAGTNAINQIPGQIASYSAPTYQNFDMSKFQQDPGYSFRLDQGLKALQNSAAARGGLLSGNTMKGINDYAQGSASQEYQNAFNRYQQEYQNNFNNYQTQFGTKLNALQSQAGLGQTSLQQANQSGSNYAGNAMQAGQNYANQAGQALVGGAQAYGQGQIGAAQASASGYMGAGNALTSAIGNYMNYDQSNQLMNALMRNR